MNTTFAASRIPDVALDSLARCESGGNYKINNGNGYQGAFQYLPSTWRNAAKSIGVTKANAHQASKEEQRAVTKAKIQRNGWGAWPTCGIKARAIAYANQNAQNTDYTFKNGVMTKKVIRTYHSNGKVKKVTTYNYNNKGILTSSGVITYQSNGNRIEFKHFTYVNGKRAKGATAEYKYYHPNGIIKQKKKQTFINSSEKTTTFNRFYDTKGQIIRK